MNGGEFLQGLYVPEPGHCRFPSSERLVRVLGPVVEPTTAGPGSRLADHSHRSPVGRQPVRDDRSRPAITLHRAFQKPECSLAIPPFRGNNLKHFAFVVNGATLLRQQQQVILLVPLHGVRSHTEACSSRRTHPRPA